MFIGNFCDFFVFLGDFVFFSVKFLDFSACCILCPPSSSSMSNHLSKPLSTEGACQTMSNHGIPLSKQRYLRAQYLSGAHCGACSNLFPFPTFISQRIQSKILARRRKNHHAALFQFKDGNKMSRIVALKISSYSSTFSIVNCCTFHNAIITIYFRFVLPLKQ